MRISCHNHWQLSSNFLRQQTFLPVAGNNNLNAIVRRSYSDTSVLPTQARVVIAGAGVVGNSIAYHLSKNGWKDVLVCEQNEIGSNAANFGSGILGLFKPIAMRNLINASISVYQEVATKGFDIGFQRCGSINLAQTSDRMNAIKRRMAYNRPNGLHCELLSPEEIQQKHPLINAERLLGGVWVPDDAIADPQAICHALAKLARQGGVSYHEHCAVLQTNAVDNRTISVETESGTIVCEYFVNCVGMWCRQLGLRSNPPVCIPTYAANHFYAITGSIGRTEADRTLPIIRDYDARTYFRQLGRDEMFIGWFERDSMNDDACKDGIGYTMTDSDRERCQPLWERAVDRMPALADCDFPLIHKLSNNFTPDGRWILGEAADVRNYFVAVGMNGNSLQCAGGIGKAVAEWLIEGSPTQALVHN